MTIRFDEFEEAIEVVVLDVAMDELLTLPVHDAHVHLMSMENDGLLRARSVGLGGLCLRQILLATAPEARIRS